MIYNREKAIAYAHKWAFDRNPEYFNFDALGGDCTNFISQCLFAGCGVMNYTRDTGWYYVSPANRAAAWSGVEFLYKFLTTNKGVGPRAREIPPDQCQPGDIIQLSFDGTTFGHSLFVVGADPVITIATHTYDSDNRPLFTYEYDRARGLGVEG